MTITVTGTNDAPTLAAGLGEATEDGATVDVDLAALAGDVDSDDDASTLTYSVTGAPSEGGASITGGTLTFDPAADFQDLALGETRDVEIEVTATDAHGATAVNTVTITVTGTNDAPVATALTGDVTENASETEMASSVEADLIAPNAGRFYIFDFDTGLASQIARGGSNTTYDQVAANVLTDGNGIVFQINPNNSGWGVAAFVYDDDTGTGVPSGDYVINDSDGGVYNINIDPAYPETVAFDDANQNVDNISLTITDLVLSDGRSIDLTMDVNNIDYEVGGATDNVLVDNVRFEATVSEATDTTTFTANATDVDGDTLTYTVDDSGTAGTVTDNGDGTFDYDANGQFEGLAEGETTTDTFTYTAHDGNGGSDTETVTVTVTGSNDGPTLVAGLADATEDGASIDVDLAALGDDIDSDDDGATLTYSVTGSPASGSASITGTTLTFDPGSDFQELAAGETVDVEVEVTATDAHGATAVNTVTVTVTGSNDGPTLVAGLADATEDGASVDVDLAALGDDIDSDDDGATLTYSVTGSPASGSASITGTTLTFDPGSDFQELAAGETVDVEVEVTATDAHGATAVNTVTVTVTGENDAPVVAAIDAGNVGEDDPAVTIDLLDGQTDIDNGATLSATNITVTDDLGATVSFTDNGDGTISIDPSQYEDLDDGEDRTLTVNYDVSDGVDSTANTATLVVDGATDNFAPVANDDTLNGAPSVLFIDDDRGLSGEGTWLTTLTALGISATYEEISSNGNPTSNLADYDMVIWSVGDQAYTNLTGDNVSTMEAYLDQGGNLLYAGGHNLYEEPNAGTFASDYLGVSNYAYNMPYVTTYGNATGVDGNYTLNSWSGGNYGGTMISAFDATVATSLMELTGWTAGRNDIAAVNDTGLFTAATWGFDINQLGAAYHEAFLEATIDAMGLINPVADENTAHIISADSLLDNDTDADGDTLTITSVVGLSVLGATVYLNGDGSITYDPTTSDDLDELAEGEVLEDSFTYTISDGNGGTDTATVTLNVSGVDDPPILTGTVLAQSGFSDEDFSYEIASDLFTDHDEGGAVTYDVTLSDGSALPSWLSFDDTTNTLSFSANVPQPSDNGLYTLLVTATEEDGQSSTTTFTLSLLDGDLIEGTPAGESLYGTIQGDLIRGLGGNDSIYGLPGADVIDGGAGNDFLYGEAGDDVLIGGEGYDYLYGEDGDDVLNGGEGGGQLQGGDGDDEINGGSGRDYLYGQYGSDTMNGGDGDDYFYGQYENVIGTYDVMNGGAGNDVFNTVGYYSSDIVDAGTGDDLVNLQLYGGYSSRPINATITLGAGEDTLVVQGLTSNQYTQVTVTDFNTAEDHLNIDAMLNNNFTGWDGSTNPFADAVLNPNGGYLRLVQDGLNTVLSVDLNGGGDNFYTFVTFENTNVGDFTAANFTPAYPPDGTVPAGINVVGTAAGETLDGTIGADTLSGEGGNDRLNGGSSPDTLNGGDGRDSLYGGAGGDELNGGADYDYLYGEDGDDVLNGGEGGGYYQGGDGDDLINGGSGSDQMQGQYGSDTMNGGDGNDIFYGQYENVIGVYDVMNGGAGNDIFYDVAYYSSDVVDAGSGDDTVRLNLYGGYSSRPINANITLGTGADTLLIQGVGANDYTQATVTDFNTAEDHLNIDAMVNNNFTGWDGATNPFADAVLNPNGGYLRLVQDGLNTVLSVDLNGGGDNFYTLITFENTNVGDFTAANFTPAYPPDGTVPAGINIVGTSASETLDGTIGTDTISGEGGNDRLNGGASSDTLNGGDGRDSLYGGAGGDELNGGADYDYLYGEDGDDVLNGGEGGGNYQGGDGDDLINGGSGSDQLHGQYGSDTMNGGDGNDYFYGQYENINGVYDVMNGGAGNDIFYTVGYYSSDVVDAGSGDDQIYLQLQGGHASRLIHTNLTLGTGADTITLQNGSFNVYNQATITDFDVTEDRLDINTLVNNSLTGWDGVSNPFGSGFLRMIQDGTDAVLQIDANGNGDGFVNLITFENVDAGDLTDQHFLIDLATSQGYNPDGSGVFGSILSGNSVAGTFGDDTITGTAAGDLLNGANGADVIEGGAGDDTIDGGFGNDVLTGGTGADTFDFAQGSGDDIINDFDLGTDVLSLSGGQTISSFGEVDTDGVGGVDSTLVEMADGSTVLLASVLGVVNESELL
ncbi:MAG: tandem-95 repeat protein [Thalassovita sp.]